MSALAAGGPRRAAGSALRPLPAKSARSAPPDNEPPASADFATLLRFYRQRAQLTVAQVERFGRLSTNGLYQIERGTHRPRRLTTLKLAWGLRLSAGERDRLLVAAGHAPEAIIPAPPVPPPAPPAPPKRLAAPAKPVRPARPVPPPWIEPPPGADFRALLTAYRKRAGRSRLNLAVEVGLDPSYVTRVEAGDRNPPRLPIVVKLAGALRLTAIERGRFLVAAGYAPVELETVGGWDATLHGVARLLGDPSLSPALRAGVRLAIDRVVARYSTNGAAEVPQ